MLSYIDVADEKITLKNINIHDDLSNYLCWLLDEEVNQYLELRFNLPKSEEEIWDYVNSINKSSDTILFGIFDRLTDLHIGNIKIGPINPHHKFADIGLLIGNKSLWGRGYGSSAIKLACDYAFTELGVEKLTAGCYAENLGSFYSFVKQGFVQEGVLRNQWLFKEKRQDGYLLGKFNDFWE